MNEANLTVVALETTGINAASRGQPRRYRAGRGLGGDLRRISTWEVFARHPSLSPK